MRRLALVVIVVALFVGAASEESFAQVGVGIKLPSTSVFIANYVDANTIFEMGISVAALSNSVIAMSADGKIYFASVETNILLKPFLGAGVGITFLNSTIFFSPFVLAGADVPIPNSPLTAFIELGLGLTFSSFGIGIVPGGQLGIRFDF